MSGQDLANEQEPWNSDSHIVGVDLIAGQAYARRIVAHADPQSPVADGDDLRLAVRLVVDDGDTILSGNRRVIVMSREDGPIFGDIVGGDEIAAAFCIFISA